MGWQHGFQGSEFLLRASRSNIYVAGNMRLTHLQTKLREEETVVAWTRTLCKHLRQTTLEKYVFAVQKTAGCREELRGKRRKTAVMCFAGLHPCRRRAGTWSRTAADTDARRCTERREEQSSRNACPSPGRRQGTSPSRGWGGGQCKVLMWFKQKKKL